MSTALCKSYPPDLVASKFIDAALLLLLLAPSAAAARDGSYTCTTRQALELSASGEMQNHKGAYKVVLGGQFSIDRKSGAMEGLPFSTQSYRQVTVLDHGSSNSAYKAMVTSHEPNIWVKYIYVEEFNTELRKPFWGTDGGGMIFSGYCE